MIYIREIEPRKISGLSSFLISFQYSSEVVEAIKTLETYHYHTKDKCWEIPASLLSTALDTLTFLDDIQLIMLPPVDQNPKQDDFKLTENEIKEFKFKPFAHQIEAINFGLQEKHKKFLLLDSMGLG